MFVRKMLKCVILPMAAVAAMGMNAQTPEKSGRKWLVLDPITYGKGVRSTSFSGIDGLLLTKLADSRKYSVIDRDTAKTALSEGALNGVDGVRQGAGYSVCGEVVDTKATGATLRKGQQTYREYIVSVSLRVNKLEPPQETHIGKTVRIQEFALSEKDMLMYVVDQLVREILFKEFPIRVVRIDEDEGKTLTLNYGNGFLAVGATYEVGKQEMEEDPDTGIEEPIFVRKGLCQITEVDERRATAVLTSGSVKKGYVLRQSKAQAKAEQAAGVVASNTGDLAPTRAQAAVAAQSAPYPCVVGSFGFAADFHAYRYVPDPGALNKILNGLPGLFGGSKVRTHRCRSRGGNAPANAINTAVTVLKDGSHVHEFPVKISAAEWRAVAERAFAAHPAKFNMHTGVNLRRALQNGIRYAVNGNVSQLYEKDGQCTVKFVLTMTDLENNGSIVFSKDVETTVSGAYAGQSTFAQAVANGTAIFAGQLQ